MIKGVHLFTIAIIGRPNVGKSTLFNKLVGHKLAIVDNLPGVTRDRREGTANISDTEFRVIDTAGLEDVAEGDRLSAQMLQQTELAILDADLLLFMVDGKTGITPVDEFFANWTRAKSKPTILVVNKCEAKREEFADKAYYHFGFQGPIAISAEHNRGFNELYQCILEHHQQYQNIFGAFEVAEQKTGTNQAIKIAVVGRPNAGKSTLINSLLQEERLITNQQSGTTRDAISIKWNFQGQPIELIDTAGIRKRSNVNNALEKESLLDSFRAIRFTNIAILVIDAQSPLDKQDLAIASMLAAEGRGIVLAFNKWDQVKNPTSALNLIQEKLALALPLLVGIPLVPISALYRDNLEVLLKQALKVYRAWNSKLNTHKLNEWLSQAATVHTPPMFKQRRCKLKYAVQVATRPPTIAIFTNNLELKQHSYLRYLHNSLREYFRLECIVVRIVLRKSANPYVNSAHKQTIAMRQSPIRSLRTRRPLKH